MILAAGIIGICGLLILSIESIYWKEKISRLYNRLEFLFFATPLILGWFGYVNSPNNLVLAAAILSSIRFGIYTYDNFFTFQINEKDVGNALGFLVVGIELCYSILFILSSFIK